MLKLVIFDFDGVLFNTAKYYLKTRDIFFKKYGVKFTKEEHKHNLATTTKDFFNFYKKKYNLDVTLSFYVKEKKRIFFSFLDKIDINEGVLDLLKTLKKNKIKIALSSSNEKENVIFFLKKYHIHNYFDLILTNEDIKKHKPHPQAFLKPAEILKIKPEECIGVEDALQGIESLNKGKIKSVALLSEFTTKKDFKELNATVILKSLKDFDLNKINKLFDKK